VDRPAVVSGGSAGAHCLTGHATTLNDRALAGCDAEHRWPWWARLRPARQRRLRYSIA
jgi:hypothetical protein